MVVVVGELVVAGAAVVVLTGSVVAGIAVVVTDFEVIVSGAVTGISISGLDAGGSWLDTGSSVAGVSGWLLVSCEVVSATDSGLVV